MATEYHSQSDYVETEKEATMSDVLEQIGTDIASLMHNSNMTIKCLKQSDGRMNTVDNIIADLLKRITGIENHLFRDK